MEILDFCFEIFNREVKKYNVGTDSLKSVIKSIASTTIDINYDSACNRCAYVYKLGTANINLATNCFSRLKDKCGTFRLLCQILKNRVKPTISLITNGPALEYIAFLLLYEDYQFFPEVNLISQCGSWRNTVDIINEVVSEGYFKSLSNASFENVKVVQGDPFQEISESIKESICNSDILMMIKSTKRRKSDRENFSESLMELVDDLKPGAILFCIETKLFTSLIIQVLSKFNGSFLIDPTHIGTNRNLNYPQSCKMVFGSLPTKSANGVFFVWQKAKVLVLDYAIKLDSNNCNENIFKTESTDTDVMHPIHVEDCAFTNESVICSTSEFQDSKNENESLIKSFVDNNLQVLSPARLLKILTHTNNDLKNNNYEVTNTGNNYNGMLTNQISQNEVQSIQDKTNAAETVNFTSSTSASLDLKHENCYSADSCNSVHMTSSEPIKYEIFKFDSVKEEICKIDNDETHNFIPFKTSNASNKILTSEFLDTKYKNHHVIDSSDTAQTLTSSVPLNKISNLDSIEDKNYEIVKTGKNAPGKTYKNVYTLESLITDITLLMEEELQRSACKNSTNVQQKKKFHAK